MKFLQIALILLTAPLFSQARVIDSVAGTFHVAADDVASIIVNGTKVFTATYAPKPVVKESGPAVIKVGDHLVFQLSNNGGAKGLQVQFVSADGKTIIHFPHSAFRTLPNPKANKFTGSEFREARSAKKVDHKDGRKLLPFKGKSDWVWGDTETCAVAVIVTRDLVTRVTQ